MRRRLAMMVGVALLALGGAGCDAQDDGAFVRDIDSRATSLPWTLTDEPTD